MPDRRLIQCPHCREWWNATDAIVKDHIRLKHPLVIYLRCIDNFSDSIKQASIAIGKAIASAIVLNVSLPKTGIR